jgi:hypothetical protein
MNLKTLPKLSQKVLDRFTDSKLAAYVEPTRKGTAKGERVGFSIPKYRATLCALRDKVLPDAQDLAAQAKELQVSYGLLRKWRLEPAFKALAAQHEKELAGYMLQAMQRKSPKAQVELLRQMVDARVEREREAITKLALFLQDNAQDALKKSSPKDLRNYQRLALDYAIKVLSDRDETMKHRAELARLLEGVRETLEARTSTASGA